jgi:hypothetical protein
MHRTCNGHFVIDVFYFLRPESEVRRVQVTGCKSRAVSVKNGTVYFLHLLSEIEQLFLLEIGGLCKSFLIFEIEFTTVADGGAGPPQFSLRLRCRRYPSPYAPLRFDWPGKFGVGSREIYVFVFQLTFP